MPDDKAEAQALWLKYFGQPDALAGELIRICLIKTGVVYQIFVILDNYSTLDVGCKFLSNIAYAGLQKLVETNDGLFLCKMLHYWLNGGVRVMVKPLPCMFIAANLTDLKTLIDNSERKRNQTAQPRQLTQAEIDTYKKKAKKGEAFKDDVVWELPENGTGFITYKRNDVSKDGLDQIGTKETVDRIIAIAIDWNAKHPDRILQIGDISRPGGLDTSQHATHEDGKIFDMRPMRKDNQTGPLTYHQTAVYDVDLTKEFIKLVRAKVPGSTVLFNDKAIHTDDAELAPYVSPSDASHDNHLHIIFPGGK
jgi:hypothetical protein